MSRTRMVLLRIAGSVVGLLAVGVAVGVALIFILIPFDPGKDGEFENLVPMLSGFLASVVVGTVGAAVGATVTQKLLKQRSSFWRALLRAVVGLVVGVLGLALFNAPRMFGADTGTVGVLMFIATPFILSATIVAGAVIGSGWKAKPWDAASPSG